MADKEKTAGKAYRMGIKTSQPTEKSTSRVSDLLSRIPKTSPRQSAIFTSERMPDWVPETVAHGAVASSSNTTPPMLSPLGSPRKVRAMKLKMQQAEKPSHSVQDKRQSVSPSNSSFRGFMKPSAELLASPHAKKVGKSHSVNSLSKPKNHTGNGSHAESATGRTHVPQRGHSSETGEVRRMDMDDLLKQADHRRLSFVSPHLKPRNAVLLDDNSNKRLSVDFVSSRRQLLLPNVDALANRMSKFDLDSHEVGLQPRNSHSKTRPDPSHRNSGIPSDRGRLELVEKYSQQRIQKEKRIPPRTEVELVDLDEDDITGEQFGEVDMQKYYQKRNELLLETDGLTSDKSKEEMALQERLDVTRAWVVGNLTVRGKNGVIAGSDSDDSRDESWLTEEERSAMDAATAIGKETESTSKSKSAQQREAAMENRGREEEEDAVRVRDPSSSRQAVPQRHTTDTDRVQAVYSSTHRHDRPSPQSAASALATDGSERPRSTRQAVRPQRPAPGPEELIPARSRRSVQAGAGLSPQSEERGSGRAGPGRRVFPEEAEAFPVVKPVSRKGNGASEGSSAGAAPESVQTAEEQQSSAASTPGRRSGSLMSALGFGRSRTVLQKPFADVRAQFALREQELGRGRFGVIRVCEDKLTSRKLACKSISKKRLKTAQDIEDVRREVAVMEMLKTHPDVAHLEDTFEDEHNVHLVMELCEGGELFDRIKARKYYSERDAALVTRTVAEVLLHCHSLGIIHRDLKPENILLCSKTSDVKVKVIDYGVAAMVKKGQQCRDMAGSPFYLAPEVLGDRCRYGAAVDVWSAGVVLYILLCGVPPFWAQDNSGIFAAIKTGRINLSRKPWPTISEEAKDLVRQMLTMDPNQRITPQQILEHPFIANLEEVGSVDCRRASRGNR